MINDSASEPRIRKWSKSELRGLMILDEDNAGFYDQFSPLIQQVGEEIGMKIEVCQAMVSEAALARAVHTCSGTVFDFYFVVTNGNWDNREWDQIQHFFHGGSIEMLSNLQREIAALPNRGEHGCRYALGTSTQVIGQIEGALSIVDSRQPIVIGRCSSDLFLQTLGLFPFDGTQPLDPDQEANSLAEFLLKETPYGGTFLLRLLYAPTVQPGMSKDEFVQTLPK